MQPLDRLALFTKILFPLLVLVLLSASPRAVAVTQALAGYRAAESKNDWPAAAVHLHDVLTREPWRTWLWEALGSAEFKSGNFQSAVKAFLKAEGAGFLSAEGQYQLGEAFYQQQDATSAEAAWKSLLTPGRSLPLELAARTYERLARLQRERGALDAAASTLQSWHALEPANPRVVYLLGLHLAVLDPVQALPLLLEASRLNSEYTPVVQRIRRGMTQGREAEDAAYSWLMIGRALGSSGQWDLAAAAFQKSLDANPSYVEAWAFLGEAQFNTGADGMRALKRARELAPQSVVVKAILAMQHRREEEYDQAISYLREAAALEPGEPLWQVELGQTMAQQGDLPSALEFFQKAVEIEPETSLLWQYLAYFSADYHMDPQNIGLPAARRAVILAPGDPGALDAMGWVLVSLQDYATAERFLQQAVEKDATFTLALLHLGQLYLQAQEMERAYPYLAQVSATAGEDTYGMVARRLLRRYYNEGE